MLQIIWAHVVNISTARDLVRIPYTCKTADREQQMFLSDFFFLLYLIPFYFITGFNISAETLAVMNEHSTEETLQALPWYSSTSTSAVSLLQETFPPMQLSTHLRVKMYLSHCEDFVHLWENNRSNVWHLCVRHFPRKLCRTESKGTS